MKALTKRDNTMLGSNRKFSVDLHFNDISVLSETYKFVKDCIFYKRKHKLSDMLEFNTINQRLRNELWNSDTTYIICVACKLLSIEDINHVFDLTESSFILDCSIDKSNKKLHLDCKGTCNEVELWDTLVDKCVYVTSYTLVSEKYDDEIIE